MVDMKALMMVMILAFSFGAMAKTITVKVVDKNDHPVVDAPVYLEILKKTTELYGRGGLPFPRSIHVHGLDRVVKTNSVGEAQVNIDVPRTFRDPIYQIGVKVVGRSRSNSIWSSVDLGQGGPYETGSFVIQEEYWNLKLTPKTIPSHITFRTYYGLASDVPAQIQRALEQLRQYEVVPGFWGE